ncbi:hypothetical protein BJY52DRAFT_1274506 [Lactarius psammicola]|nr:hypothetical protein BJY52DRAFT_1274506 [Lactarius psammicola]
MPWINCTCLISREQERWTVISSSQSCDPPDVRVADAPYTEATGASEARSPLRKHRRPSEVTDHSPGFDLENCHTSASIKTSRRPFECTRPQLSTASPLVQIAYSPLKRLAFSIEDIITSTSGTLTPDANETLASWPKLERCLIKADIPTDPLAVLAAAARDSGCRTSS